jgi:hypothetical protein
MYEGVRNETHLIELINREPPWDFFLYPEITDRLFHLKGYAHLLNRFRPQSVEDLAMILAIIRPSKAYLQQATWEKIRQEVWQKTDTKDEYQFKRSHSISYALSIVVNLNILIEKAAED